MESRLKGMEYSAIIHAMKLDPAFDPTYAMQHPYRCISADEYKMGRNYRIVRENGLDDHLLLLTLAGCGIANETKLEPFSMYLFKPGERHDYGTDPQTGFWHFLWAHVHAPTNWLPLLAWKTISIQAIPQGERRRIVALFRDAVANSSTGKGYDKALAMNLFENMLLRIGRVRTTTDFDFGEEVRTYILEHLADSLDVPSLATRFRLSESRFAHRFRDVFGTPPQPYVEGCRLEMAERLLLTTEKSVKEVAYSCGFKDPLYFSKRFARTTGKSPSEWRQLR